MRHDLLAAAGEGAHDGRAAADVGPVADDHAGQMRPSTMDVPRVPALKLTKPSCITVVPEARWAPRRTRSASAMRTPDGHDVVGHPRELVHPVDGQDPAGARVRSAAARPPGPAGTGRPRSRPRWSAARRLPVQVRLVRADQPVRQQVQAQVDVGRVLRRVGQRADRHRDDRRGQPAQRTGTERSGYQSQQCLALAGRQFGRPGESAAPARPGPAGRRGTRLSRTCPSSAYEVARPRPQADVCDRSRFVTVLTLRGHAFALDLRCWPTRSR